MRVLLFTDGSAGAQAATTWLNQFIPVEPSALRIVAIAETPPSTARFPSALSSLRNLILDRSRQRGEAAQARLHDRWRDLSVDVIEGDPREHLLRAAEEWKAELVVLGRNAGGEPSSSLGSLARLGGYHLECSVLLVDRAPESVHEIVLGMDRSASAREAARLLSLFNFAPPPRVLALGVVETTWRRDLNLADLSLADRSALDEIEAQRAADVRALLAHATATLGNRVIVQNEVAIGNPVEVLLDAARQRTADLIAVGHQGLEPVRRLTLGSAAAQLLATAPCSLLIGRK
jgi:nucleotide-binding universal stress UspA family protein